MTTPVRTPAELIACLGGALAVARECDVPLSDIDRWIREGILPRGFHMRLFVRAVLVGAEFDATALHRLFGIPPEDGRAFCNLALSYEAVLP